MDRPTIIAVDFDGCLCKNAWPYIGEARQDVIDALLSRQKKGAKIILWTCRVGERLEAAVDWCRAHGITFDAINENLPVNVAAFGNDCRKVFADEYWDDKAINPEICDVSIPTHNMDNSPLLHILPDDETAKRISEERAAPMKSAQHMLYALKDEDGIARLDEIPDSFFEKPINEKGCFIMADYIFKVSISKPELNNIMQELEQAKRTIYKCFTRLEDMGLVVTDADEKAVSDD